MDIRRVSCPVAQGDAAGMNLDWLASEFYQEHCAGVPAPSADRGGTQPGVGHRGRRQAEAAAAAEAERQATVAQHRRWAQREERRRAVMAGADPAMAGALGDIAVIDHEPGRPADDAAARDALGRLTALADRAPGMFTSAVVELAVQLVEQVRRRPRCWARSGIPTGPSTRIKALAVLSAALSVLRVGPVVEAGLIASAT